MSKALLRTDGGAGPKNPGHAAFACVVEFPDTPDRKKVVLSRYIGLATNNVAEYLGLIVGSGYAFFLGAREIEIISDSKLVVYQVNGEWKTKTDSTKVLCRMSQDKLNQLYGEDWNLSWQKRIHNTDADALCKEAIIWGRNRNPFTPASIKEKRGEGKLVDPFGMGSALLASFSDAGDDGWPSHNGKVHLPVVAGVVGK